MKKSLLLNACILQLGIFAAADKAPIYSSQALSDSGINLLSMAISQDGSSAVHTNSTKDDESALSSSASLPTKYKYHIALTQTTNGKCTVSGLADKPGCLRFNRQGTRLAIGLGTGGCYEQQSSSTGTVAFFRTETGTLKDVGSIKSEHFFSETEDFAFNHDGTRFLKTNTSFMYCNIGGQVKPTMMSGHVKLYDFNQNIGSELLKEPGRTVGRCTFSDDGRLYAAQIAGMIKLWDSRESLSKAKTFEISGDHTNVCFSFSPDNSTMCSSTASSSTDGANIINLLSIGEQKIIEQFELTDQTNEQHTSGAGNNFRVTIPWLKAMRAYKKMVGEGPVSLACTNADETVLLYQKNEGEQVFLSKA